MRLHFYASFSVMYMESLFFPGAKLLFGDIRKMREIKSATGGFTLSGATPMTKPNDAVQLEHVQFIYKVK